MSQEVGKTDETEWEDEQIGGETWLKSYDKRENSDKNEWYNEDFGEEDWQWHFYYLFYIPFAPRFSPLF